MKTVYKHFVIYSGKLLVM